MLGIILIIFGILILVAGLIIYSSSLKVNKKNESINELQNAIEMAIADGILTDNERKIIKQIAEKKGLDYGKTLKDIETRIAESNLDSETELIDFEKKNGYDFEKFIVKKFDKKFYNVKEWAGDKFVDGIYADTTPQPDLLMELRLGKEIFEFSVECKWRQNLYSDFVKIAYKEQFDRYKNFEENRKIPVFIAIGIGGKADSPEKLYIVPLRRINSNFIHVDFLIKFEKKIESDFFFNDKKNILD